MLMILLMKFLEIIIDFNNYFVYRLLKNIIFSNYYMYNKKSIK